LEETALQRSGLAVLTRLRTYYDPESRSPEVRRALVDPIFFGERYVRPHDARWIKQTAQFQKDMVQHLLEGSRFDPEILKQVHRPEDARDLATTAYRTLWIPIEHAMTTWLSVVIPLWIICIDQESKGALIGNRVDDAMKPLAVIKWHVENNQLLRGDFPEVREDRKAGWSDERIFVQRRDRTKDPTVQTSGITGTIQGARLDWAFGDDVQDRRRALSDAYNQADQENWQEIIENRIVDGGVCSTYGTLQSGRDLTATMSRSPGYRHMHLSAYDTDGRYGKKGEPIWMPRERLELARARQGERRFARKYLNDSKDEGGKLLRAEHFRTVTSKDVAWAGALWYAGVDPATGESESADPDEYSIVYGIRERSGRAVVCGSIGSYNWGMYEGMEQLKKLHGSHHLTKVAIESVAFQVAVKQQLWRETSIPAYKSPTSKSKEMRFESMGSLFEIGRAVVLESGPGIYEPDNASTEENLYDQWIDFNEGRHDDRLDAMEKFLEAALGAYTLVDPVDEETRKLLTGATFLD
jgi:predicted phage terminase large subunit-like protein